MVQRVSVLILSIFFCLSGYAQRPTNVVVGTTANDGTGDPLRLSFQKLNYYDNWAYTNFVALSNTVSGLVVGSATDKMSTNAGTSYYQTLVLPKRNGTIVYAQANGAAANGSTDDRATLNTLIAALSAGETLDLEDKTYAISDTLTLAKNNVTIRGNGATLKITSTNWPMLNVTGTNVQILGVRFNLNLKSAGGIKINPTSRDVEIAGCWFYDGYLDSVLDPTGVLNCYAVQASYNTRRLYIHNNTALRLTHSPVGDSSRTTGAIALQPFSWATSADNIQDVWIERNYGEDIGNGVEGCFIRLFNGQYADGNLHINFNQCYRYGKRFAKLYFQGGEFIGNIGYTADTNVYAFVSVYSPNWTISDNNMESGADWSTSAAGVGQFGFEVGDTGLAQAASVTFNNNLAIFGATGTNGCWGYWIRSDSYGISGANNKVKNAKYGMVVNGKVKDMSWANFTGTNLLSTPILMQASGGFSPENVKFLGGAFRTSPGYAADIQTGTNITTIGVFSDGLTVNYGASVTGERFGNNGDAFFGGSTNANNYFRISSFSPSYYFETRAFPQNTSSVVFNGPFGKTFARWDDNPEGVVLPRTGAYFSVLGPSYFSTATVNDDAYDATAWNGSTNIPTKNAIRDKIESLSAGGGLGTADIDTSAELRAIVTDESGTGALIFAGGDIGAATATTAAADDNTTKVATTAYVQTEIAANVSDTAYDATSWNGVTGISPSKNAVRDEIEVVLAAITAAVSDTAFASSWNGVTTIAPSKNAVYDWAHIGDPDDDGKPSVLDMGAGIVKTDASGNVSAATSGTDYAPATSGTAILKGNGSGGFSSAVSSTDYAPATSGSAILKANGSGGFSSASAGTDYQGVITIREEDGSPSVSPVTTIRVSNGTLTDNTGGSVSITTGGGSGSSPTTTRGDMIRRNASADERLAIGAFGTALMSDGTDPDWFEPQNFFRFFDDFTSEPLSSILGDTGWTPASASGSIASTAGEAGHPGIINISTSTSSSSFPNITRSPSAILFGGGKIQFQAAIKLSALSDASNDYIVNVGFIDQVNPTDGVWFEYRHSVNSGNWQGKAKNNAGPTTVNGSVAASTSWTVLKIVVAADGSTADFYVNGTNIGTASANIPTATGRETSMGVGIWKQAGTTARVLSLDYVSCIQKLTSSR